jgi:hypothetical protein
MDDERTNKRTNERERTMGTEAKTLGNRMDQMESPTSPHAFTQKEDGDGVQRRSPARLLLSTLPNFIPHTHLRTVLSPAGWGPRTFLTKEDTYRIIPAFLSISRARARTHTRNQHWFLLPLGPSSPFVFRFAALSRACRPLLRTTALTTMGLFDFGPCANAVIRAVYQWIWRDTQGTLPPPKGHEIRIWRCLLDPETLVRTKHSPPRSRC